MDERRRRFAISKGLGAIVALLAPLLAAGSAWAAPAADAAAGGGARILFYVFGALTIVGAIATIVQRSPVKAALCLVATLFCTAGVYLSLHATFMAAIQVLVYAGAVMVLFIFVVMSVGNTEDQEFGLMRSKGSKVLGLLAIVVLGWRLISVLMSFEGGAPAALTETTTYGTVGSMADVLFTKYLFPFEAISVLLLVSIVGAVIISRRVEDHGEEA